ncbi:hypothetical protein GQX74_001649 [Glossina fuscipes]|nr:hypothetical protein GQX74_001649 [Glossina fuscipes]
MKARFVLTEEEVFNGLQTYNIALGQVLIRSSTMSLAMKRKRGRPRRDEPPDFNEFDLSLIQKFKQHPVFYDCKHPKYRNREYTNRIWGRIADDLNVPIDQIKLRINQLRNRYIFEKKRLENLRQGDSAACSKWTLYKHLDFLSDYVKIEAPYNFRTKTSAITIAHTQMVLKDHSLVTEKCDHLQSTCLSRMPTTPKDNAQERCKAFGQFLSLCLMEMDENQSLKFIEKFTIDLVKTLRRTPETERREHSCSFSDVLKYHSCLCMTLRSIVSKPNCLSYFVRVVDEMEQASKHNLLRSTSSFCDEVFLEELFKASDGTEVLDNVDDDAIVAGL